MKRYYCFILLLCMCAAAPCLKASADITLIETMNVDTTRLMVNGAAVPPATASVVASIAAALAPFGDATFYATKSDLRIENVSNVVIFHKSNKSATMLFPSLKQYITVDSAAIAEVSARAADAVPPKFSMTDLHLSEVILGHTAHEYMFTVKSSPMVITGNIWVSDDFPELNDLNTIPMSTNQWTNLVQSHIKGVPLKVVCVLDDGADYSGVKLTMTATGISTDPITPTTFQPPKGYTELIPNKASGIALLSDAISRANAQMMLSTISSKLKLAPDSAAPKN